MGKIGDFFRALAGRCDTPPLDPSLWSAADGRVMVELGQVAELKEMGGSVYLQGQGLTAPVLVINSGPRGYMAYENRCTHAGRKLDPVGGGATLRCCSVSHSTFGVDGGKLSGPAKGPVKQYPVEVADGRLVIEITPGV